MTNGKHHDHPLTDMILHGSFIYNKEITKLVQSIDKKGGITFLKSIDWLGYFNETTIDKSKIEELKKILTEKYNELSSEKKML